MDSKERALCASFPVLILKHHGGCVGTESGASAARLEAVSSVAPSRRTSQRRCTERAGEQQADPGEGREISAWGAGTQCPL